MAHHLDSVATLLRPDRTPPPTEAPT
jgi:hypothetical protein